MSTRRKLLLACGFGVSVAYRRVFAQTRATSRPVGSLGATATAIGGHLREAFKQEMRELGWREGINVDYGLRESGTGLRIVDEHTSAPLGGDLMGILQRSPAA